MHFTNDNFEAGVFLGAYGSSLPQACERLFWYSQVQTSVRVVRGSWPHAFVVAKSHHLFILALPIVARAGPPPAPVKPNLYTMKYMPFKYSLQMGFGVWTCFVCQLFLFQIPAGYVFGKQLTLYVINTCGGPNSGCGWTCSYR